MYPQLYFYKSYTGPAPSTPEEKELKLQEYVAKLTDIRRIFWLSGLFGSDMDTDGIEEDAQKALDEVISLGSEFTIKSVAIEEHTDLDQLASTLPGFLGWSHPDPRIVNNAN